jgi:hypothetical protein
MRQKMIMAQKDGGRAMDFAFFVVTLFVGFIGGYGLREYISQRRRAAYIRRLHEAHFQRAPTLRPKNGSRTDPVLLAKFGLDPREFF